MYPIIPQCNGQVPGATYCGSGADAGYETEYNLYSCGPDLVTATVSEACPGTCANGACVDAGCGDGRVEGNEQCDDGNHVPLDGCENNCKLSGVLDIKAGQLFTCALLVGGYVRCWGHNQYGELGLGHIRSENGYYPYQLTGPDGGVVVSVDLGGPAAAIAVGDFHACALLQDSSVRCWGDNAYGQLGLGNEDESTAWLHTPAEVGPISISDAGVGAIAIAAGGVNTCVILQGGSVECWGDYSLGQLGLATDTDLSGIETPAISGPLTGHGQQRLGGCHFRGN